MSLSMYGMLNTIVLYSAASGSASGGDGQACVVGEPCAPYAYGVPYVQPPLTHRDVQPESQLMTVKTALKQLRLALHEPALLEEQHRVAKQPLPKSPQSISRTLSTREQVRKSLIGIAKTHDLTVKTFKEKEGRRTLKIGIPLVHGKGSSHIAYTSVILNQLARDFPNAIIINRLESKPFWDKVISTGKAGDLYLYSNANGQVSFKAPKNVRLMGSEADRSKGVSAPRQFTFHIDGETDRDLSKRVYDFYQEVLTYNEYRDGHLEPDMPVFESDPQVIEVYSRGAMHFIEGAPLQRTCDFYICTKSIGNLLKAQDDVHTTAQASVLAEAT